MALKKNEESLLKSIVSGARALSRFVKDPAVIRAEFAESIAELEQSAQVVLRMVFIEDELDVIVEDRSQDKVNSFFNTTGEKLLLRAQLNTVPIDVLVCHKGKNILLSNDQISDALAELSVLVRAMPLSIASAGKASWSLVAGENPTLAAESSDQENAEPEPDQETDPVVAHSHKAVDVNESVAPLNQVKHVTSALPEEISDEQAIPYEQDQTVEQGIPAQTQDVSLSHNEQRFNAIQ